MSVSHTTPAPAPAKSGVSSLLRWVTGGRLTAVVLAAVGAGSLAASEAELDVALDDLSSQASDFRTQGP